MVMWCNVIQQVEITLIKAEIALQHGRWPTSDILNSHWSIGFNKIVPSESHVLEQESDLLRELEFRNVSADFAAWKARSFCVIVISGLILNSFHH